MIIDSHQHFWKLIQGKPATPADELAATFDLRWLDGPKMAPIRRDWMPEDLAPRLKASGVDRSIIVQTQHSLNENQWAVDYLAAENDAIAGVVGWVDLASPQCEEQVLAWKAKPKFVERSGSFAEAQGPVRCSHLCEALAACTHLGPRVSYSPHGDRPPGQATDQGPCHQ